MLKLAGVLAMGSFGLGMLFYYLRDGYWQANASFDGVYLVSGLIVMSGLGSYLLPVNALLQREGGLLDHSNYGYKAVEKREQGKYDGNYRIGVGFCCFALTAVAQWLVSLL